MTIPDLQQNISKFYLIKINQKFLFQFQKSVCFDLWFLCKRDFLAYNKKDWRNYQNRTFIKLVKNNVFFHIFYQIGFKGTFVNRALPSLHKGSLRIMLTVPLNNILLLQENQELKKIRDKWWKPQHCQVNIIKTLKIYFLPF